MPGLKNKQENKYKDLGFGTRITNLNTRLLNPDGSFNVKRQGLPFFQSLHLYHALINMSTLRFIGVIFLAFFCINCFFATLYLLVGIDGLQGIKGNSFTAYFWETFFFSAQTFTTVGYGGISPIGFLSNLIASIESMLGWLAFALATGLVYGRFSRPKAKLLFSQYALIAPYGGEVAFEFRIANLRNSQLIEVEAQLIMTRVEKDPKGSRSRKFYELELERYKINVQPLSWTIVHPISQNSPMKNWQKETMKEMDIEFIALIKGFDETFNQTIYARRSYRYSEIIWGAKFENMYDNEEAGITTLQLDKMDEIQMITLPDFENNSSDKIKKPV